MKKQGKIVKCWICGEDVYKKRLVLLKNKRNFCSRKCQQETFKGVIPWNKGMRGEYESNPPNSKKDKLLVDKNNRVWIYKPKHPRSHRGRVSYPRYLMEKKIGRYLDSDEIVHHIDHDPTNNKIDNLYLTNRSEHARIHKQSRKKI